MSEELAEQTKSNQIKCSHNGSKQRSKTARANTMAALFGSLTLASCAGGYASQQVQPIEGPKSTIISTDYSGALKCVANYAETQSYPAPRIAVGHITDFTGATDFYNGKRLTQGATLMAMTAVADAGMRLVERFDMGVIQVDLDYAKAGLVRDSDSKLRSVDAGQLEGADLYIVGGITEFNPNLMSGGIDVYLGGTGDSDGAFAAGASYYIIDVGIDLRLVDARSSEVLSVRSFKKQIVGYEREAGVFDLIGGVIFDVTAGKKALEPVQSSVRTMVDRAVFDFTSGLYAIDPNQCLDASQVRWKSEETRSNRGSDRFYDYHAKHNIRPPAPPARQVSTRQRPSASQMSYTQYQPATRQTTTSTRYQSNTLQPTASSQMPSSYYYRAEIGPFPSPSDAHRAWYYGAQDYQRELGSTPISVESYSLSEQQRAAGYYLRTGQLSRENAELACHASRGSCRILKFAHSPPQSQRRIILRR